MRIIIYAFILSIINDLVLAEPADLKIDRLTQTTGGSLIEFTAPSGTQPQQIFLQQSTNLLNPSWITLTNASLFDLNNFTFQTATTNAATRPHQFYRIGLNYEQPINNPLIQNDAFFTGSHWNDPHVIYTNKQFFMYASSDFNGDGRVKIYRLVSNEGLSWQLAPTSHVLEGSENTWDSDNTETPAIVFFQGRYHLFYTGYDVSHDYSTSGEDGITGTADDDISAKHFKIGHAISTNGIDFIKQGYVLEPSAPYDEPTLHFNQYVVGEPAPVVYNGKIYLYFTSVGADQETGTILQVIGLMTYDGAAWDAPRWVLKPDTSLYPPETYMGYSTPNALIINNIMHLYVDVILKSPWTQVKLHHAFSLDGETSWIQDPTPLRSREDYPWTHAEIRSPSAIEHNGLLYLYFAGHTLTPTINLAIGLEILPLP